MVKLGQDTGDVMAGLGVSIGGLAASQLRPPAGGHGPQGGLGVLLAVPRSPR